MAWMGTLQHFRVGGMKTIQQRRLRSSNNMGKKKSREYGVPNSELKKEEGLVSCIQWCWEFELRGWRGNGKEVGIEMSLGASCNKYQHASMIKSVVQLRGRVMIWWERRERRQLHGKSPWTGRDGTQYVREVGLYKTWAVNSLSQWEAEHTWL